MRDTLTRRITKLVEKAMAVERAQAALRADGDDPNPERLRCATIDLASARQDLEEEISKIDRDRRRQAA